ncbi:MAG TPA: TetR/AcrR family transcriptional regulator [Steroidobacteraceae bacterium]
MSARAPDRLAARRERILEEGRRLFLSRGYAGASVNEIVRRAGGSLATLYSEFGSKEALFAEIMRQRAHVLYGWQEAECLKHKSEREALIVLGRRLLERILSKDGLAWYRIVIGEGPRCPELRKTVLEQSYPVFIRSLGDALVDLNIATRKDSAELAEEFVSLLYGQIVFRAACAGRATISPKALARHVERVVDRFLALHPVRKRRQRSFATLRRQSRIADAAAPPMLESAPKVTA